MLRNWAQLDSGTCLMEDSATWHRDPSTQCRCAGEVGGVCRHVDTAQNVH
eukprot:m.418292 g.418292  ORF g.418292 m.418292 type:complete len:50 (+) comp21290_c0_seq1:545-694(+)